MKFIRIEERGTSPSGKTKIWFVIALQGGIHLGSVKWFAAWRQYVFEPSPSTVYEQICLRDIASFVESANRTHKEK